MEAAFQHMRSALESSAIKPESHSLEYDVYRRRLVVSAELPCTQLDLEDLAQTLSDIASWMVSSDITASVGIELMYGDGMDPSGIVIEVQQVLRDPLTGTWTCSIRCSHSDNAFTF